MTKEEKRLYDKDRRERNREALKAQKRAYYLRTRVRKYATDDWRKLPEVRDRISAKLKGRKWSPEALARRVASQTGLKRSPEIREKFRERMQGKCYIPREAILRSAEKRRGKKLSAEHRAKLVAAWDKYPHEIRVAQRSITMLKKRIHEKQDNGSS